MRYAEINCPYCGSTWPNAVSVVDVIESDDSKALDIVLRWQCPECGTTWASSARAEDVGEPSDVRPWGLAPASEEVPR